MTPPQELAGAEGPPGAARLLEGAALAIILAVLSARPFAGEMPFVSSQLVLARAADEVPHQSPDELLRLTFSMALLVSVALWAAAQLLRRRSGMVGAGFAAIVVLLAGWSFLSAVGAVDARRALSGWFEQTCILLAALVMMQLARRPENWGLLLAVLAAMAGTVALKGLAQVTVEFSDQLAHFQSDPEGTLALRGIDPGTPAARMFEKRLREGTPFGYFGLANMFASLLIVLAAGAAGIMAEKLAAARADRRAARPARRRGEVHLPTLAAALSVAPAVLAGAVLVLTRSKGGIAAGAAAAIGAVLLMARRGFFARHRRKLLPAAGALAAAGICAVAVYGSVRGGLPSRSMQVRWEYWVGATQVTAESPLFGVGTSNFGPAYLRHRLPTAAEGTKYPHTVILGSVSQFGLVGGAAFLALLVWVLVAATRPGPRQAGPARPSTRPDNATALWWCIFLAGGVAVVRAVWDGSANPYFLITEAIIPGFVFALLLLASLWAGKALGGALAPGPWARIALGAGLAGLALHNLITYTIFTPAVATVFWLSAGAAAGRADLQVRRLPRRLTGPLAAAAVAGLLAAGVWLYRPVFRRTVLARAAQKAYSGGRPEPAAWYLRRAAQADPLDAYAPADLARLYLAVLPTARPEDVHDILDNAVKAAELAWRRSPTAGNALWLARALRHWPGRMDRAVEMVQTAVGLDPMDVRTRSKAADMLLRAGRFSAALEQIGEARRIDSLRPADSDLRLTPAELDSLRQLEQEARAASAAPD